MFQSEFRNARYTTVSSLFSHRLEGAMAKSDPGCRSQELHAKLLSCTL
jgi:hypothetical protein